MSAANVLKYLTDLGIEPTDLKRIIITHSDPDHVSALADLVTASGAGVFANEVEARAIADGLASRPLKSRWAALVLKVFLSIFKQKPARVDQLLDTAWNCRSQADCGWWPHQDTRLATYRSICQRSSFSSVAIPWREAAMASCVVDPQCEPGTRRRPRMP